METTKHYSLRLVAAILSIVDVVTLDRFCR